MTIQTILKQTTIDRLDAELILCYILGVDRTYIKAHAEQVLSLRARVLFFWYTWKRKQHLPLAFILGTKECYGLVFEVNKHTLVPRPDTEILIEQAINLVNNNTLLIDVGTGSGCIPIAIGAHTTQQDLSIIATDISRRALRVAKRNAQAHQVDIHFLHGNLLAPALMHLDQIDTGTFKHIIITANLPYITEDQWQSEASIKKEPKSALVADEGGLALYRELLEQLTNYTRANTLLPITLLFEIDPEQEISVQSLVHEYYSEARVILQTDLAGNARTLVIHI